MVSVSGVRGIVGASLTPEVIVRYVGAFAALHRGSHVVVGRDSRQSGPWVQQLVEAVLRAAGKRVTSLGVVATPTVQLAVLKLEADGGGVVVTSSHNPVEWNGLKFVAPDSLFVVPEMCALLYASPPPPVPWAGGAGGVALEDLSWSERHAAAVLACPAVAPALARLRALALPVALDTVRGAGGPVMRALLEGLGCRVVAHLYPETTGLFPRPPEPVGPALHELGQAVRDSGAALGIAVDPDVDRCVLLDERGEPLGEEYTLACAVHYLLGTLGRKGVVVRNLSSSRATDDICRQFGSRVVATPVGEVHVARAMLNLGAEAVVGGEGNGGVLLPELHLGRDAPVAAALALCFLLHSETPSQPSKAFARLPQYAICKMKGPLPPHFDRCVEAVAARMQREAGPEATVNHQDGVRIDTPAGWVHLRRSNTEPIFRVIGEFGSTLSESTAHCQSVLDEVAAWSKKFSEEEEEDAAAAAAK